MTKRAWLLLSAIALLALTAVFVFDGRAPQPATASLRAINQLSKRPDIIRAIEEANAQPKPDIAARDAQWKREYAAGSRPLINEIMKRPLSTKLAAERQNSGGRVEQIMVMDKHGALIAADKPTHDYDQSDEPKWKQTAGAGRKDAFYEATEQGFDQVAQAVKGTRGEIIGAVLLRYKRAE